MKDPMPSEVQTKKDLERCSRSPVIILFCCKSFGCWSRNSAQWQTIRKIDFWGTNKKIELNWCSKNAAAIVFFLLQKFWLHEAAQWQKDCKILGFRVLTHHHTTTQQKSNPGTNQKTKNLWDWCL
jgi:hypothetical protein